MNILLIVVGVIVFLNLLGFGINKVFFSDELNKVSPYGQMVEVKGQKMHVYSMGDGEETIVLLPGFGVALPSADFAPLMRKLADKYTVVCIEYFGIGFSDKIDTPRTNENYTEEIRTALSKAGFESPYILMPHSASGVYSEYYAAKYPDEVSAIIMLDTTTTAKTEGKNIPKFVYQISVLQQATGLTRIAYSLVSPTQKVENGYTEKEIADYKLFAYHVLNDTIIDQSYLLLENIREVNKLPFPEEIPVLKLISSQSLKKEGEDYQQEHLNRLGPVTESKVIDSSHFIYQTNASDIYDAADEFLDKNI